jgi:hypothetical protein
MARGRKVKKECKNCENDFEALLTKVRQGGGLYCSTKCYNDYRKENKKDPKYLNILYQKKHKYGLSEEEYLGMFESQNHCCAICKESFNNVRACVDHSHNTGDIRGLLCDKCNTGLGLFQENIQNLLNAIKYIEDNDKKE